MELDEFNFDLPPNRIALEPAHPRDSAKLLVAHAARGAKIEDKIISDLPSLLRAGDRLVLNNSYVVPARVRGKTPRGAMCDVLLCAPLSEHRWHALMKGRADKIIFSPDISAERVGDFELEFNVPFSTLYAFIEAEGKVPLPPYIEQRRAVEQRDVENYQTIYHKKAQGESWGSIAAPTAGLHFTDRLLAALKEKQIELLELTLHVGVGTFLPVKTQQVEQHKMLAERAELSEAAAAKINETKAAGGRIIAVGTTSVRTLESAAVAAAAAAGAGKGRVESFNGTTDLFIYPSYEFKVVDGLLTNFHLPRSTPLLLVSALIGVEALRSTYAHALREGYRFFSYGDACLFLPNR